MNEEKDYGFKEVNGFEIINEETGEKIVLVTDSYDMKDENGKSLKRHRVAIDKNLLKFWITDCRLLDELEIDKSYII